MPNDLNHYLNNQAAFDVLSEADKSTLFGGGTIEGETPEPGTGESLAPAATEEPGASPTPEPAAKTTDTPDATPGATGQETDPVVLAKDGKHTIPFSELESARKANKHLEGIVASQKALLEQMQAAQKAPGTPPAEATPDKASEAPAAPPAFDMEAKEREYINLVVNGDDEGAIAVRKEINAEMQRQSDDRAAQRFSQAREMETAQSLVQEAAEKVARDYAFINTNEQALSDVLEWRDFYASKGMPMHEAIATAAAKVAPLYLQAAANPAVPAQEGAKPGESPAAKAAKIVQGIEPKTPTSLSEVPAGAAVHHDETAAMLDMDSLQLMNKFSGKSHDQIMDLMNRVI